MFIQKPCWPISLEKQPKPLQIGIGVHGDVPVERYQLGLWCLHLYRYIGELSIDDVVFPIRPGHASITPPHARLEYRYYGRAVHAYAHFECPSSGERAIVIPAMQDLGERFEAINQAMEQAVGYWATTPQRAGVRLWDVLWQLTDGKGEDVPAVSHIHPVVEKVLKSVELRLNEPLVVADLAQEVGVSHNHLTRLFREYVGMTVVGYIQERRVERARHLLTQSTRSIKSIAIEVGIADLHQFNKVIRRRLGGSPRSIRRQGEY